MRVERVAWIALATHVAAGLASFFLLQPGTPVGQDAASRLAYVEANLGIWRLGWLTWTFASLSLVALLFALHRPAAWLAAAALAFDLPSQFALALPVWTLERAAYIGTGVIANAMYTAALAWAVLRAPIPRWLIVSAVPAIASGAVVTLASWLVAPTLLFLSAGVLTAAMIGWTCALGAWAWRTSS